MKETVFTVAFLISEIGIRVMRRLDFIAGTDLEQNGRLVTPVLQRMAIRHPGPEAGAVASAKHRLDPLLAKHHLA